jgi:hypothetical protein
MVATSGIQLATLSVAALAVITSFAGPYVVARFSVRSEHRVWQRDLRIGIYNRLAAAADEYSFILGRTPPPSREERLSLFYKLAPKASDVDTYGSLEVRLASLKLMKEIATGVTDVKDNPDIRAVIDAVSMYREAVRKSLNIGDD